jgi:hypothetical protein
MSGHTMRSSSPTRATLPTPHDRQYAFKTQSLRSMVAASPQCGASSMGSTGFAARDPRLCATNHQGDLVTESTGNLSTQPGWYPDPSGLPRQRWWDGTQWTDHLYDPAAGAYGALPGPALGAGTPVYNALIWTIVLLPLVSLTVSASMDVTRPASGSPLLDPLFLMSQALGWGVYLATALFAFYDRRALLADGFTRPFHWAWAFLSGGVYVIGRSVIVRRRAGRGLAPVWAWLAVTLLAVIVGVSKVMAVLPSVMSNVPSLPS